MQIVTSNYQSELIDKIARKELTFQDCTSREKAIACSLVEINYKSLPADWDKNLSAISAYSNLVDRLKKCHPLNIPLVQHNFLAHNYLLPFIIQQKWDSKQKLPRLRKRGKQGYKILANMYVKAIDVCLQIQPSRLNIELNLQNKILTVNVENPAALFAKMLWESDLESAAVQIFREAETVKEMKTVTVKEMKTVTVKAKRIKEMKRQNKDLKSLEFNPFDPTYSPATYTFVREGFDLANRSDLFRKNYWRPFISARAAWTKEFQKAGWLNLAHDDDRGRIGYVLSNGSGKKLLSIID